MTDTATMPRWHIKTYRIDRVVVAVDQNAAWNTLRNEPVEQFGLLVTAEPDENGDPIGIRTSTLMFHWGRDADARIFIALAISLGMPDTTEADMQLAGRKP